MRVKVECYSGYKPDERPERFYLNDRCLEVQEILDRWYDPHAAYFRLQASDGNLYVLRHDWSEELDRWTLEAYRDPKRTE
ncbi:MAG: hypothetical protein AB1898_15910 [Acidobacteriota bacterium]